MGVAELLVLAAAVVLLVAVFLFVSALVVTQDHSKSGHFARADADSETRAVVSRREEPVDAHSAKPLEGARSLARTASPALFAPSEFELVIERLASLERERTQHKRPVLAAYNKISNATEDFAGQKSSYGDLRGVVAETFARLEHEVVVPSSHPTSNADEGITIGVIK